MRISWRWLAVPTLVVVAIVAVVLVSGRGSTGKLDVSVVLTKETIHVGSTDGAVLVNNSRFWLNYTGCPDFSPRVGSTYTPAPHTVYCLAGVPIPPHSHWRVSGLRDDFQSRPPGEYWFAIPYGVGTSEQAAERSSVHLAYTKLTIGRYSLPRSS